MSALTYRLERQRQRRRTLRAVLALGIWALGAGLLFLAWDLRTAFQPPLDDLVGTAIYLVTFFYIFALWPISLLVDRVFPTADARGS
jgi:RsiW-degrading membrane proteinase PrsW (M82 family)